jgi:hypothetical protein
LEKFNQKVSVTKRQIKNKPTLLFIEIKFR